MKVMLVFPPQSDVTMPGLALPCLAAALRNAGHEVIQKDVNIESFDRFLSREYLEKAYEHICTRRKDFVFSGTDPRELDRLIQKRQTLMDEVENAKRGMRDSVEFYNHTKYMENMCILEDSLRFISLAYYRTELSFYSFDSAYSSDSTEEVMKAITNEHCNPYIEFYRDYTLPDIIAEAPKVVAISISMHGQVIPGLTLAYMIKQAVKDVHVEIGGSYFTNLEENLKENHPLFSLFDSVILYEGETALTDLVNCIDKGLSLEKVPNLIYKAGDEIVSTGIIHIEKIEELLTPDFDGLPFHLYFSPELILPIYASKGCYWHKCAFCNFTYIAGNRYRARGEKKVREDMERLIEKYDCNTFVFVDDALSITSFEAIADEIIQSGIEVNWFSFARFEKQLNKELCTKLYKAGCRVLTFGLESACDRVLTLIEKGTKKNTIKDILAVSSEAGIANYVSLIFGFPTETIEETKETIRFILDNADTISWIRSGSFSLLKNSKIECDPEKYKVTKMSHKESHDLALMHNYEVEVGLSQKEAENAAVLFSKIVDEFRDFLLNLHFLLYIKHHETNDILWATASQEEQCLGKIEMRERRLKRVKEKADTLFKGV